LCLVLMGRIYMQSRCALESVAALETELRSGIFGHFSRAATAFTFDGSDLLI
jgi:hypothetical protein